MGQNGNSDQNQMCIRGARIIARDWLHLKQKQKVLIVTSKLHEEEALILENACKELTEKVQILVVAEAGKKVSQYFDEREDIFDGNDVVVGACDYSLVTTKAVRRVIKRGGVFLSLPLSTNDGRSMLAYDFIQMDTKKSKMMAGVIKRYMDDAKYLRVKTKAGTDIKFRKKGRPAGFFNGDVRAGGGFSSASIELYVPIEEDQTEGVMVLDGSLGYIGAVKEPFRIELSGGRIVNIEDTPDGRRLKEYLESFEDDRMYVAAEFGIGLNSYSRCIGNCYIEDESAYGTYHIGFGRNLALGGKFEASSHFDLVTLEPDIYADNRKIMEKGRVTIPEPQVY